MVWFSKIWFYWAWVLQGLIISGNRRIFLIKCQKLGVICPSKIRPLSNCQKSSFKCLLFLEILRTQKFSDFRCFLQFSMLYCVYIPICFDRIYAEVGKTPIKCVGPVKKKLLYTLFKILCQKSSVSRGFEDLFWASDVLDLIVSSNSRVYFDKMLNFKRDLVQCKKTLYMSKSILSKVLCPSSFWTFEMFWFFDAFFDAVHYVIMSTCSYNLIEITLNLKTVSNLNRMINLPANLKFLSVSEKRNLYDLKYAVYPKLLVVP